MYTTGQYGTDDVVHPEYLLRRFVHCIYDEAGTPALPPAIKVASAKGYSGRNLMTVADQDARPVHQQALAKRGETWGQSPTAFGLRYIMKFLIFLMPLSPLSRGCCYAQL